MTAVEILRGAKVELAKRGLHKGDFFADLETMDGPCCVRGACKIAAGSWDGDHGLVGRYLRAACPTGYVTAVGFNDDPETTIDDVQALLDRAIARAEAGEGAR